MTYSKEKEILIKTDSEVGFMSEANQIVAETLKKLTQNIEPGVTTLELDRIAESYCIEKGSKPAFKGYRGFPSSLCASVNEEVVHGIPSKKVKLKKGDILSIDFGVFFKGFYGDSACTVCVGEVDEQKRRLVEVTKESLYQGIKKALPGNRVSDISRAIQNYVEENNFSVVRQFVGHGIGRSLHEGPEIPNFIQNDTSPRLIKGMVIAIEPMVNAGTYKVKILRDGWTVITGDKLPSAHFEHSIAITANEPLILSAGGF